MTFSPLLNVQPSLIVMVKFCESVVSIFSASMSLALPVFGSYLFRPRKIMSRTLPPCTSLVLAGSSGFCGSPQEELERRAAVTAAAAVAPPAAAGRRREGYGRRACGPFGVRGSTHGVPPHD